MEVSFGDAIAAIALAFSLYTFWRQRDLDQSNKRLNALLIEKEETESLAGKRADLSANFVNPSNGKYELRIYNRGKGAARNVQLVVTEGEELFRAHDLQSKFPYPALDVHQPVSLMASVHMQSPRRAVVRLTWEDDAGEGEKEITADVF